MKQLAGQSSNKSLHVCGVRSKRLFPTVFMEALTPLFLLPLPPLPPPTPHVMYVLLKQKVTWSQCNPCRSQQCAFTEAAE